MKKLVILITLFIIAVSASIISAEDAFTRKCEPEIIEGSFKTTACWFFNGSGEKAVDPEKGYAGKRDVYEMILPDSSTYYQVSASYFDPDGNPMMGPDGYAKVTIESSFS